MRSIVKLFLDKVISQEITIDNVPKKLQEEVRTELEKLHNENIDGD